MTDNSCRIYVKSLEKPFTACGNGSWWEFIFLIFWLEVPTCITMRRYRSRISANAYKEKQLFRRIKKTADVTNIEKKKLRSQQGTLRQLAEVYAKTIFCFGTWSRILKQRRSLLQLLIVCSVSFIVWINFFNKELKNLCPISLLSISLKVMERIIAVQLGEHASLIDCLYTEEFGCSFRWIHSFTKNSEWYKKFDWKRTSSKESSRLCKGFCQH